MAKILYAECKSCVKGERFKYSFSGGDTLQYVALLTPNQFDECKTDFRRVRGNLLASPAVFTSSTDDEVLYLVRHMNGKEYPKGASALVERFSPLIPQCEIDKNPGPLRQRVKNAQDTDADGSMIQYWRDNVGKLASIDLSKSTCRCPSCGKMVNTSDFDGAHVVIVGKEGGKVYITPTCKTCNRSKVDRIFEVSIHDCVVAPE